MSKSLVDKMSKPGIPIAWITEVEKMLRQIEATRTELETRIKIIDTLATEREELVKILINTVNAIDRAWDSDEIQYKTDSLNKIVRHLDNVLVGLEDRNGRTRTK